MDLSGCMNCKKITKTLHNCEDCNFQLCRECDDKSTLLSWYEPYEDYEQKDVYLCNKCIKRRKKKEKKELDSKSKDSKKPKI